MPILQCVKSCKDMKIFQVNNSIRECVSDCPAGAPYLNADGVCVKRCTSDEFLSGNKCLSACSKFWVNVSYLD